MTSTYPNDYNHWRLSNTGISAHDHPMPTENLQTSVLGDLTFPLKFAQSCLQKCPTQILCYQARADNI